MGNHKIIKTAGVVSRYSMYEFIAAIKSHSILWDRKHENFHNRELRDQAWKEVASMLCKHYDSADDYEKREISKTLLKRWKNTRDSYLRVNRLRETGEDTARSSYIYEKELSFLLGKKANETANASTKVTRQALKRKLATAPAVPTIHVTNKSPRKNTQYSAESNNSDSGDDVSDNDNDSDNDDVDQNAFEDMDNSEQETQSEIYLPVAKYEAPTTPAKPAVPPTPATPMIPATLEPNTSAASANIATTIVMPSDPDQAFFESIKPHMQKMSDDKKLDFQIEVLVLLRNFKEK